MADQTANKTVPDGATPAPMAAPEGWQLVPKEPTFGQIMAAAKAAKQYMDECGGNSPAVIYEAMLAASPAAPTAPEGWIATSERLPELNQPVWLYEPNMGAYIGERGLCDSEHWLWGNCYMSVYQKLDGTWYSHSAEQDDDYAPTHWMPLPPAPTAAPIADQKEPE